MNVHGNWETQHYNSVSEIMPAQLHFWEYINRNQTFILDSHRPFICSVIQLKSRSAPEKYNSFEYKKYNKITVCKYP